MTLDNLVGLGLEVITPDAGAIKNCWPPPLVIDVMRVSSSSAMRAVSTRHIRRSCKWLMPLCKPKDTAR